MLEAIRNYFDSTMFDEVGDSFDLLTRVIQKAFNFDALENVLEFQAIVLTPPIPISFNNSQLRNFVQAIGSSTIDEVDNLPKFAFKVRIIGPLSPHMFWPDPCDPKFVTEVGGQEEAIDWILKHTDILSLDAAAVPNVGDIVTIKLNSNIYTVNPEKGVLVDIVQKMAVSMPTFSLECQGSIKGAFEGYTPPPGSPASLVNRIALQKAYKELYLELKPKKLPVKEVYEYLYKSFGEKNKYIPLIRGMLANIQAESGFNIGVISGATGESSIGLFQMNVGGTGRYAPPVPAMENQFKSAGINRDLMVFKNSTKVPYFAGALYLAAKGNPAPAPTAFSGNKEELRSGYASFLNNNANDQIDFVVKIVKDLLKDTNATDPNKYSAKEWSSWFQIYFEQPANIKPRSVPRY